MKKLLVLITLLIISESCEAQNREELIAQNAVIDSTQVILPDDFHSQINKRIAQILTRYHYKRTKIDDSLSSLVYDNLINSLDHNKYYFLKSDIDKFESYRYSFDENLVSGTLDPPYEIFNVFKVRLGERVHYILETLKNEFDYTIDEYFEPDRSESSYAETIDELDEIWRKRLKNEALSQKLAGKEWKDIADLLSKRYKSFHKSLLQYKSEDIFQLYMNAFANTLDPHTNYFSPMISDDFNIRMKLSLEGIGARLTSRDDYTTVVEIIPGGPAYRSKLLNEDDRIVGVAQGDDGEMVDVVGWRIDEVVQLIRGDKGTIVKLAILKDGLSTDMPPDTIRLVRDEVKLEDQSAQKKIITIKEQDYNFKVGVIEIPTFYIDFEAQRRGVKDYKSTSRDVKKLLAELTEEGVDGIIVDLRRNGGGSLQEAVDVTGLFIEEGPVVQVKDISGSIDVNNDPDPEIVYPGPLAVLVNRSSASASEIFSGAIQDYGRGIIIGENTFGKGTVQNLIDLKRFIRESKDRVGQLKLTIAKYYRITGSSTQNKGVVPDIEFPSEISAEEYGESSQPSALPWDQINPTDFKKYNDISSYISELSKRHLQRISNNIEFQYKIEDIKDYNELKEKTQYSLLESQRILERNEAEEKRKAREEERQKLVNLEVIDKEEVNEENLRVDDPYLEETGHILADLILMSVG